MKRTLIAIALFATACGGSQTSHDVSTTDPSGVSPTMNETAGAAPVTAPPAAPQQTETFDRYDNSGFAGLKTESMSPVAAATRSGSPTAAASASAPATNTAPATPAPGRAPALNATPVTTTYP